MDVFGGAAPIDASVVLEKLGCLFGNHAIFKQGFLGNRIGSPFGQRIDGTHQQCLPASKRVVHDPRGVVWPNGDLHAVQHVAGVDFMLEQERGCTSGRLANQYGPMNGGSPPVLRQEGAVKVDGAETWPVPNHLGQHSEGHHDAQVGVPLVELGVESLVFELLGLGEGQVVLECNLFDVAGAQGLAAARRAVRGGHHSDHLMATLEQLFKACGCKQGRSEEHHTQGRRSF